ncbi:MAG: hypothetical protein LC647_05635 [Beggiatoa sp.]|nr:hypothetical protein [Beggiatoa sp.]
MGTWPPLSLSSAVCDGQALWYGCPASGGRWQRRGRRSRSTKPPRGVREAVREQRRQEARVPVVHWVELLE